MLPYFKTFYSIIEHGLGSGFGFEQISLIMMHFSQAIY